MTVLTAKLAAIPAQMNFHVLDVWPGFTLKTFIAIDANMDAGHALTSSYAPKLIQDFT